MIEDYMHSSIIGHMQLMFSVEVTVLTVGLHRLCSGHFITWDKGDGQHQSLPTIPFPSPLPALGSPFFLLLAALGPFPGLSLGHSPGSPFRHPPHFGLLMSFSTMSCSLPSMRAARIHTIFLSAAESACTCV